MYLTEICSLCINLPKHSDLSEENHIIPPYRGVGFTSDTSVYIYYNRIWAKYRVIC